MRAVVLVTADCVRLAPLPPLAPKPPLRPTRFPWGEVGAEAITMRDLTTSALRVEVRTAEVGCCKERPSRAKLGLSISPPVRAFDFDPTIASEASGSASVHSPKKKLEAVVTSKADGAVLVRVERDET